MKAVVLEVRDGVSVVLKKDGTYEKINKAYQVGREIEVGSGKVKHFRSAGRRKRTTAWMRGIAAAAIVALAGTLFYSQTAYAVSYVTVDTDSSVEFSLNAMNRVIEVNAVDESGEELAKQLNEAGVRGKTLTDALEKTTFYLEEQESLSEDNREMLVSVTAEKANRREELSREVALYAESSDLEMEVYEATPRERHEAREHNMSTGRYEREKRMGSSGQGEENAPSDNGPELPEGQEDAVSDGPERQEEEGERREDPAPGTNQRFDQGSDRTSVPEMEENPPEDMTPSQGPRDMGEDTDDLPQLPEDLPDDEDVMEYEVQEGQRPGGILPGETKAEPGQTPEGLMDQQNSPGKLLEDQGEKDN
ncbi:MAG: hypothetical protein K5682_00815 [Lachnospiraceae bacterium]|nr:hypothetical protein [Lachnospiraceae bacterium]